MNGTGSIDEDARTRRDRWIAALLLVLVTGAFAMLRLVRAPSFTSDLDQLWHAARALRLGQNPYGVVGPGRPFEWGFPLFYPLPAVLLALPFSFLPVTVARVLFSIVSATALGYAVGPRWRILWPLVPSASYYLAISRNQWAPLVLAAVWVPALGFIVAAKPNVGVLAVAAQDRRSATLVLASAGALTAVAFLVRPTWFAEWLAIVRSFPNQRIALVQPGGFLLLAALILWRSSDGRVILAATLVPQTPSVYDALPLFLLCRTTRQALILSALTHVTQWSVIAGGPYRVASDYYLALQRWSLWLILFPCLIIALMNRFLVPSKEFDAPPATMPPVARREPWMWPDRLLACGVVISLALQLWIVFQA